MSRAWFYDQLNWDQKSYYEILNLGNNYLDPNVLNGHVRVNNMMYTNSNKDWSLIIKTTEKIVQAHHTLLSELPELQKEGPVILKLSENKFLDGIREVENRILNPLKTVLQTLGAGQVTGQVRVILKYWAEKFDFPSSPQRLAMYHIDAALPENIIVGQQGMVEMVNGKIVLKHEWYCSFQKAMWMMGVDVLPRKDLVVMEHCYARLPRFAHHPARCLPDRSTSDDESADRNPNAK
jgi:hypothetical protein